MVVSRSRPIAPGHGGLTLRIPGETFDSKLTFKVYLREVVLKVVSSLGVSRRAGKLFDCQRVLRSCVNAYVLSNLEYCVPVWMSSTETHLSLLDRVVSSAEGCVRVNFVIWGTEGGSVHYDCSISTITEHTTLCMSICVILLQLVILELQLLWES